MPARIEVAGLQVDAILYDFIVNEALPGTGLDPDAFWRGTADLFDELSPRNRSLLATRDELQSRIDEFHTAHPGQPEPAGYHAFLREIGYLADEPEPFQVTVAGVDSEITDQAGPQLVVPLLNARFAINAANARWGSLYDALYGTDVIPVTGSLAPGSAYNPERGAAVVARGREFLDESFPLRDGSHADSTSYAIADGALEVVLADGSRTTTIEPSLVGYTGDAAQPSAVLLRHNGLHVEIQIDREDRIGGADPAGVKDLVLEAAVTTIMDLEDSVAAVDAEDKTLGYRNWLGLMTGGLQRRGHEERRHVHANLGGRSRIHLARRVVASSSRPLPAVHPPRRPSDDDRRRARPQRRGGAGGHPGRDRHRSRHRCTTFVPAPRTRGPDRCTW